MTEQVQIDGFMRTLRSRKPMVHTITNYVTVNDVVNFILASGGTAICADAPEEAAQITSISDALVLNIGTPSPRKEEAMLLAGMEANRRGIPVVLDPVGAGSSDYRMRILHRLMCSVQFACIRGNASEIAALCRLVSRLPKMLNLRRAGQSAVTPAPEPEAFVPHGVEDAGVVISDDQIRALADRTGAVIAVSGVTDRVFDGTRHIEISGGSDELKRITGSGCILSGFLGACVGTAHVRPAGGHDGCQREECDFRQDADVFDIVCTGMQVYARAAENAEQRMKKSGIIGTASFRQALIDAVSVL